MNVDFNGRVVLVTGGGSGIGQAVCHQLSVDGALLVVLDREPMRAQETVASLAGRGIAVDADVANEADMEAAVAMAVKTFGKLDIAVNAAGIGLSSPIVDQTLEQIERLLHVNLSGVLICMKWQARQMITQGHGGVIVNIASTNALQPGEGISAYSASKAGVAMATKIGAMELARHNIRVVGVGPGLTETPMVARFLSKPSTRHAFVENIPLQRPGQPQDIANAVAFLASDAASYMTGSTIYVDGGALTQKYPSLAART